MSQVHPFQAEVRQLLDIVIHALYSNREVFIRELVSNASDALEKVRLKQLTNESIYEPELALEISISVDPEAKTVTIADSGIGMSKEEIQENLGTIAHSGTKKFLEQLKAANGSADVIGQFGVGFYSAFMVADKVEVFTHSANPDELGWKWSSDGQEGYELSECADLPRGTKIVLYLKSDQDEFCKEERVRGILKQYSNFVSFPLKLSGEHINTVGALWMQNSKSVTEEEYKKFYQYIAHTDADPHSWFHFQSEVPLELHALLFVPKENFERFGFNRLEPDVALYCRKVLIDAHPEGLMPEWLRFLKGVIDSEDLPLNISREMLQDNTLVRRIGEIITKRFIRHMEGMAKNESEKFLEFYRQFSRFLKEGIVTDFANKDSLSKLLRFESTATEVGQLTSFEEYLDRMPESQKDIYYLSGESRSMLENSPYLDAFKARGFEVLLMIDNGDDFVVESLQQFGEKKLVSVMQSGIELPEQVEESEAMPEELAKKFQTWIEGLMGDKFAKTSLSDRPAQRPALALASPDAPSLQTREFFRAMGQEMPEVKPSLELNPRNETVKQLALLQENQPELAEAIAWQIADSALVSAGLMDDPAQLANHTNDLLAQVLKLANSNK